MANLRSVGRAVLCAPPSANQRVQVHATAYFSRDQAVWRTRFALPRRRARSDAPYRAGRTPAIFSTLIYLEWVAQAGTLLLNPKTHGTGENSTEAMAELHGFWPVHLRARPLVPKVPGPAGYFAVSDSHGLIFLASA